MHAMQRLGLFLALLPGGLSLWAAGAVFEVRNGPREGFEHVVSLPLSPERADAVADMALLEQSTGTAVPWCLDRSGATPVLCWILPGITPPGAVRRFAMAPGVPEAVAQTDLEAEASDGSIRIRNSYFEVTHPRRGGGGFPRQILFRLSGRRDSRLYFLDRLYRRDGEGPYRGQYRADADPEATAEIVFRSPVRVVVEARTRYVRDGRPAPGNPAIVYRYVYTPFSPVVAVSARASREDDLPWNEQHFLHLSRDDLYYTAFVTGEPPAEYPMQAPETRSLARPGNHWAVMATAADAAGVGGGPVTCWDASDEFVYYIVRDRTAWTARTAAFEGRLYFGPAAADAAWYSRWLGGTDDPSARIVADAPGTAATVISEPPPEGEYRLANEALRLTFAGAERGFACLGIENLLVGNTRFVRPRDGAPGLWRLQFRTPFQAPPAGEATPPFRQAELSNLSPADASAREQDLPAGRRLTLVWRGLDLPDEADAVDVTVTVLVPAGNAAAEWRIAVANRSTRCGLWEVTFPLLTTVCPPGTADVLLPRGNWGGTLVPRSRASLQVPYPSAACPVQCMAFHLGEAGLYFAAHDGAARPKSLRLNADQDASFVTYAEGMGVPGSSEAAPFPFVVAAYAGDWWQAARRYRAWATRQHWARRGWIEERTDVPERLKTLGLWWLGGGTPEDVLPLMEEAGERCPLPVGLHWYNWHQIPFDHSYPEYFPTKPGFAETVRTLTGRGQVIMPYINGRLWDRDIPSFAQTGRAAACKQADGEVYVEIYGSKRNLCPMCPATPLWQQRVRDLCLRLIEECGVNAIYLDQIGAAQPRLCFDPTHGHPLGGGRHWVDGYRTMLEPIKKEAAARGVILTTENTAEPYMDTIDAYLAWNPRYENDVPLLPAVYSGYTVYFTSPQAAEDDLDAFAAAQGRDFLWGCQLGWNGNWLLRPEHRDKLEFQLDLCQLRLAGREFMVFGELLGEIEPLDPVPHHSVVWNRTERHTARTPQVRGTLWRSRHGRLGVFLVNAAAEPRRLRYDLTPARWLPPAGQAWLIRRVSGQGTAPCQAVDGPLVHRDEILAAREARLLVIEPMPADAPQRAREALTSPDPILAACARAYVFAEALAENGLRILPPEPLRTVVRGEPVDLSLDLRAEPGKGGTLRIDWPDGATETLAANPGQTVRANRLVRVGTDGQTDEVVTLRVRWGTHETEYAVHATVVPEAAVDLGWPAAVRAGESFLLPVAVTNNSRSRRPLRVLLEVPPDWGLEPGRTVDVGMLPAGASRSTLVKCSVPPAAADVATTVGAAIVPAWTRRDLKVLAARSRVRAPRLEPPPEIDGILGEWPPENAFVLGPQAPASVRMDETYAGAKDCSADVRLAWDPTCLYLGIAVTDDVFCQEEDGFQLWQGDCVQLAVHATPPPATAGYDGTEVEIGLALTPSGPTLFEWMPGARRATGGRLAVVRTGDVTVYEAAIPWQTLGLAPMAPGGRLAWSMTVNDNDGDGFRGWLEWTPGVCGGKDSSAFGWLEAGEP
ncbi:MAG: hypothetical protein JXR77_01840 [Lentisphaeria bacterium]|nr:hypothetical protein [Lentisphaeria bacterium]